MLVGSLDCWKTRKLPTFATLRNHGNLFFGSSLEICDIVAVVVVIVVVVVVWLFVDEKLVQACVVDENNVFNMLGVSKTMKHIAVTVNVQQMLANRTKTRRKLEFMIGLEGSWNETPNDASERSKISFVFYTKSGVEGNPKCPRMIRQFSEFNRYSKVEKWNSANQYERTPILTYMQTRTHLHQHTLA